MSEGEGRLTYRIEFEADETSLEESINKAMDMARPKVEAVIAEVMGQLGMPTEGRPSDAMVPTEIMGEIRAIADLVEGAIQKWDFVARQSIATQRDQEKTVHDLMLQAMEKYSEWQREGIAIGPQLEAIFRVAFAGLYEHLEALPEDQRTRFLGTQLGAISNITTMAGELRQSLRGLSEMMRNIEFYGKTPEQIEVMERTTTLLGEAIGHPRTQDILRDVLRERYPEGYVPEREITFGTLFRQWMGVPEEVLAEVIGKKLEEMDKGPFEPEELADAVDDLLRQRIDLLMFSPERVIGGEVKLELESKALKDIIGYAWVIEIWKDLLEEERGIYKRTLERAVSEEAKREIRFEEDLEIGTTAFAHRATAGKEAAMAVRGITFEPVAEIIVPRILESIRDMMSDIGREAELVDIMRAVIDSLKQAGEPAIKEEFESMSLPKFLEDLGIREWIAETSEEYTRLLKEQIAMEIGRAGITDITPAFDMDRLEIMFNRLIDVLLETGREEEVIKVQDLLTEARNLSSGPAYLDGVKE